MLQSCVDCANPALSNLLCYRGVLIVLAVLTLLIMLPTHGVSALTSAHFRQTLNISVANFQVTFLCIMLN
jgi:Na+-transporting methylmalonyl-CoA/oxaloacetate decarboxylase gamma subunit